MAVCYECYKKAQKDEKKENKLIIFKELDICESCAQRKPVIAMEHTDEFATFMNGLLFGQQNKP